MRNLDSYTRDERREAINQVIISKRDRQILELRLLDGMTYSEISAYPGVCLEVRQIGKILNKGCAIVGDYLDRKQKKRWIIF